MTDHCYHRLLCFAGLLILIGLLPVRYVAGQQTLPRPQYAAQPVGAQSEIPSGSASMRRAPVDSAWYEGFEGPDTSWVWIGGDAQYRIEEHRRSVEPVFVGNWSEFIRVNSVSGSRLFLAHDVGHPRVTDSLAPSLRIKSDRAGIQLWVELVLPRSIDQRTQKPRTALVPAGPKGTYSKVGEWQQLSFEDITRELRQRTWAMRIENGPEVDPGDAYVNRLLLNVYTGPGRTSLWIDDLNIVGHVKAFAQAMPQVAQGPQLPQASDSSADRPPLDPLNAIPINQAYRDPESGSLGVDQQSIEIHGAIVTVEGRTMVPRIIEYRGEPVSTLKKLGFNTIWLPGLPDQRLLSDVRRERMWIVCPAPVLSSGVQSSSELNRIGPEYDRVLGWCLGRQLEHGQVNGVVDQINEIQSRDSRPDRLIVCEANSGIGAYSRQVDVMLFGQRPLLTSFELKDYMTWLLGQQRLSQPGMPIWATVQTQPPRSVMQQWSAMIPERFQGQDVPSQGVSLDQIRMLARSAMAAGGRGLLFESDSSLDADDNSTKYRAAALELMNMELTLLEPWMSGGTMVAQIESTEPSISGIVMETERSRLLVPQFTEPGGQFVLGKSAGEAVSFVVPGVPEDYEAYLYLPGSLRPLRSDRAAGGVRVTIDKFTPASVVVLLQDPKTLEQLTERALIVGRRSASLRFELARMRLLAVVETHNRLRGTSLLTVGDSFQQHMSLADQRLRSASQLLSSSDSTSAYIMAERAVEPLRIIQRAYWLDLNRRADNPLCSAGFVCYDSLPWLSGFMRELSDAQFGPNLVGGGMCEEMGTWLQSGWKLLPQADSDVYGQASLSPGAARSGRSGLRLTAVPTDPDDSSQWVRSSPVTIRSPGAEVRAGSLVCVTGWVSVPADVTGSVEGLRVMDSVGGVAMAQRFGHTNGSWQRFTMYRYVSVDQRITVTFELTGLGEAWVDDVSVREVQSSVARRGMASEWTPR